MKISYFRTPKGYIGVTAQSPQGMKGMMYVGRGSDTGPEGVKEQVFALNQLNKFTLVEAKDVPDEWFNALGYEKRAPIVSVVPHSPRRESPAEERSRRQRIIVFSIVLILSLLWIFIFR